MNIGIIGSGRVGCSMGKYLKDNCINIVGYYDTIYENAASAAQFTNTDSFSSLEELVNLSDTLFITTPDGIIAKVWDCIKEMSIENKIICHFSGSLSSVVFSDREIYHAVACSIHPMLAFSNKYSSYDQLNNAFFTIEGDKKAVEVIKAMYTSFGNTICEIDGSKKGIYHGAASILSNQVIAVLDTGYSLLEQCGFSREEAIKATSSLVRGNVENVINAGTVDALTGPIERNDIETVKKHLSCIDEEDIELYKVLGRKLIKIAKKKNVATDYSQLERLLCSEQ